MNKLYTVIGYTSKKMKEIKSDKTPFELICSYKPGTIDIDDMFTKEMIQPYKSQIPYFLAGQLKNSIRNNKNLIEKQLVVLDYDNIKMMYTVFLNTVKEKLSGISFMLYPTISNYTPGNGLRFRLVIDTDRSYTEKENKRLIQNVIDHIGVPCDAASQTYSQLMGLPILNQLSSPGLITIQQETPLKVDDFLFEPIKKRVVETQVFIPGDLTHDQAVKMVQSYTDRVGSKLYDRSYYLNPYLNVKFAYEQGEIDLNTVEECLTILALDNADWATNNIDHFKRDTAPVTNGTPFANFFGWAIQPRTYDNFIGEKASFENIKRIKKEMLEIYATSEETDRATYQAYVDEIRAYKPENQKELFMILETEGILKRQFIKDVKELNNGELIVKRPRIKPRSIANILKVHCKFYRLIVQSDEDSYPFIVYDMKTGLYKQSFDFLKRLILKIDYEKLEHECKQVKHFLSTECQKVKKTTDGNLIVCKNGVFNRTTRELESFSPKYVFLTGINTNYIKNASEPVYQDGWNVEKWIKQLANGNEIKEKNFWRCIFHANNPNIEHRKSVFFYSEEGRTGKGTFKDLIVNMVGEQNHANANLKRFSTKWVNAEIYGKTFVSGDENDDVKFLDGENFKTAVTNDYSSIEQKGERTFTDRLSVFIIQLMNEKPNFNKFNSAEKNRLLLVEFKNQSYIGKFNNPNVKERYVKDEKLHEYILYKVLNMDQVDFEDTEESNELIFQMELKRKPVKRYWLDYKDKFSSKRVPISFLYDHGFMSYMKAEGVKDSYVMAPNTFIEELKKELGTEWEYTSRKKPGNYFKYEDFSIFEDIEAHEFYWRDDDKKKNQRLIERKE